MLTQIERSLQRMELAGLNHTRAYRRLQNKYEKIKNGTEYNIIEVGDITINRKTIKLHRIVLSQ